MRALRRETKTPDTVHGPWGASVLRVFVFRSSARRAEAKLGAQTEELSRYLSTATATAQRLSLSLSLRRPAAVGGAASGRVFRRERIAGAPKRERAPPTCCLRGGSRMARWVPQLRRVRKGRRTRASSLVAFLPSAPMRNLRAKPVMYSPLLDGGPRRRPTYSLRRGGKTRSFIGTTTVASAAAGCLHNGLRA